MAEFEKMLSAGSEKMPKTRTGGSAEPVPHEILRKYSRRRVRLNLSLLPPETPGSGVASVLIEGSQASLEYLAELILAVARDENCGFGVSPSEGGSSAFHHESELGLYIHRLPCVNVKLKARRSGQAPCER